MGAAVERAVPVSGYEEAAAQGLLAGLNAARNALGLEHADRIVKPKLHQSLLACLHHVAV